MLSSQYCPGDQFAHISATIYLQPLQIGLCEDRDENVDSYPSVLGNRLTIVISGVQILAGVC